MLKLVYFTTYDPKVRCVKAESVGEIGDLFPQNIPYVDLEGNQQELVAVDGLVVVDHNTVIRPSNPFKVKEVELALRIPHHPQEILVARDFAQQGDYSMDTLKVSGVTQHGHPFTLHNINFIPFTCT